MRHLKRRGKLGRLSKHRESLLANLATALIRHNRTKTTLSKAKALQPYAEKLVTLAKKGSLHHRRLAAARLHGKEAVQKLFADIGPRFAGRAGGYTRVTKLGYRLSDAARMAVIEWTEATLPAAGGEKPSKEAQRSEAAKTAADQTSA
ncbi:50S ribosomal protein L17 [Methylacidimicrobium cyclopophantes]|uniref:Large ribosomal subunit protein bL17 n=1 Tax=Methylacidimicrobium cyclopophantes TaxID=1041766 RepID=A0A5E6MQ60_9BACT|nr:50S ribosomal protein L17 [Methylacidimicrobium cyclopophantes]VVM07671.1 50S ribosomal protein L17 [Methylacidimicrobium cyclopophantes]